MITIDKIKQAHNSPIIRSYTQDRLTEEVTKLLAACHAMRGTKPTSEDLALTAREFSRKLLEDYRALGLDEVGLALREGMYSGKKIYGLNPVDLAGLMNDYIKSDEYRQYADQLNRANYIDARRQLESSTKSDEVETAKLMLRKDYNEYMKDGRFSNPHFCKPRGTFCYDFLVKCGKLTPDAWKQHTGKPQGRRDLYAEVIDTKNVETVAKARAVDAYIINEVNKRKNG